MTDPVVVVGAGPAGLTAAHALVERGVRPVVVERDRIVGGLARTEVHRGFHFDIGGHRFYTKVEEVAGLWERMLGDELLTVARLSRIQYEGRFFRYPLDGIDALSNLGLVESGRVMSSYLRAQLRPARREETFEQWVANRFGDRLYQRFFKRYTEKVWGMPCDTISADWAAQRIKGLSLRSAVRNALWGGADVRSLVEEFRYPRLGPGMMWERFRAAVEQGGGEVRLACEVERLHRQGRRITAVTVRDGGAPTTVPAGAVISSMPVTHLLARLDEVPETVLAAARALRYRAFILVGLIVDAAELFPDNWIYVHTPAVQVGRIQNFKNWSAAMVPDPAKTSIGMEYFCDQGDALWRSSDAALIALATRELAGLGLARAEDVADGVVYRQPMAYPAYTEGYQRHVDTIRSFLATFENLQTVGRNGMHRYNNQDHSMLTALLAVRNLFGESNDLWSVNTERSYGEEMAARSRYAGAPAP